MDNFGNLNLKWANGYQGTELHFVNNETLVYSSGNILNFIHLSGEHLKSIPSEGKGIGPLAVSSELGLIAYAEASLEPLIYVINYPSCSVVHSMKGDAKLEYQSLRFSTNGYKLVCLSGIPDFLLTIWNLDDGMVICQCPINQRVFGQVDISINPNNWKQLCLACKQWVSLWTVEMCDTQILLTSVEINLPEKDTPVGTLVQPRGSDKSSISREGSAILDLTLILYKSSYDEIAKKLCPVIPVSHCWTAHNSIYIGCEEGQLLLADFDSGTIKILVNPSTKLDLSEKVTDDIPKTGHALLSAGAMSCIALTARGLLTAGKDGHIYCFKQSNELNAIDSCKLNDDDIVSVAIEQDMLAIGTKQCCLYKADLNNLSSYVMISRHHSLPVVGLDVLSPGTANCLTCQENGLICVWDICSGQLLSTFQSKTECTSLICPMSSHSAIVGTKDGFLLTISLVDIQAIKVVKKLKLFQDFVKILKADSCGQFVVTSSCEKSTIFVCSAKPDQELQVLGYTDVGTAIQDISILRESWDINGLTRIATLSNIESDPHVAVITVFRIPNKLADGAIDDLYQDSTRLFNDDSIFKQNVQLSCSLSAMVLTPNNSVFIVPKHLKSLCKLALPPEDVKVFEESLSGSNLLYATHELPNATYNLSFHMEWLISVGEDGKLIFRFTDNPEDNLQCAAHHYKNGGGTKVAISTDGQFILTVGDKSTLTCWQWQLTGFGKTKMYQVLKYGEAKMKQLGKVIENQNVFLDSLTNVMIEENQQTWLEIAIEQAHKAEDEKYAELKAQLREDINKLREKVLSMITHNETLPDIEKLSRSEFILDTEEHQRHQKEEEEQVAAMREKIELENLAKIYLHDILKRKCWTAMTVKGRSVKAFQSRIEVSNYALKSQSPESIKELEKVKTLRKIEIAEKEVRGQVLSTFKQSSKPSYTPLDIGAPDEEEETAKKIEEELEPCTLCGSRASEYGANTELLYDQFDLVSPVTKKHQIILLKDCIRQIKEAFNKEFDEVMHLKNIEIGRIQEKNIRIRKIARDLKLNEEIIEPKLDSDEQPETLLTVSDGEIEVEKYISPEEKLRLEEAAKEEEERKLREMSDNWRERGLDMMMGGRLEANAEEELFKDLPRPDFMDKDPVDLTEDEIRLKHEFEKKEAAWLEEREKLKKALEAEMKKHQEVIRQSLQAFDERVMKLFQLKLSSEKTVLQEELKILRLSVALLSEEEVKTKEIQLENNLNFVKNTKVKLANALAGTKKQIEDYQEYYEQMVFEDKELEKAFRKDFADCEPYVDQMFKLFKRRPKTQKLKLEADIPIAKSNNPTNPSAGSLVQKLSGGVPTAGSVNTIGNVADVMSELDDISNMPEGMDIHQWERFVAARHRKVESERKVKNVAMNLAEMNSFLRKREKEDDKSQNEIQQIYVELNKLHEGKALFDMDAEVQFLVKQGQVEIDTREFLPNFTESVLIHRSNIEELNHQIKTLGEAKLASMVDCKDFKKGIRILEWELKRLQMEAEDLVVKSKDVQMLRVTKELQERLMMENIQSKDQHQIETLEKTIKLNKKIHKRRLCGFSKELKNKRLEVEERQQTNNELDTELKEMSVEVVERQNVQDLAGTLSSEANREARMKDIVSRRKLVELAKSQAQEIHVLRAEVERLRMKTFPALVQVENI